MDVKINRPRITEETFGFCKKALMRDKWICTQGFKSSASSSLILLFSFKRWRVNFRDNKRKILKIIQNEEFPRL